MIGDSMNFENLIDKKYGMLTVKSKAENKGKQTAWLCECECKNTVIVTGANLKTGHTKSCGCLQKEIVRQMQKKNNKYKIQGNEVFMYTSSGKEFTIDIQDFENIRKYCWHDDNKYIFTNVFENGKKKRMQLHRLIIQCPKNMIVDHKDGNPLNNKRNNLRICTRAENNRNIALKHNNTSGVTGVDWIEKLHKWRARITYNYKSIHIGYYETINQAMQARVEAEEKYFGQFSRTNSRAEEADNVKENKKYTSKSAGSDCRSSSNMERTG